MDITLSGIAIKVSDEQRENAQPSMDVTLPGIVIVVRDEQPENVL